MTFKSEYSNGIATFTIGDITRSITMTAEDFNGVSQLINEARSIGAQEGISMLFDKMKTWAEGV